MVATERIPVFVTAPEKRRIARKAKAAGLSRGEFLRRAADSYRTSEDDKMLEGLLDQVVKTTARASAAVDRALIFIERSNKRIAKMDKERTFGL